MVSKLNNVDWPKGEFTKMVKKWQEGWFYMADMPLGDQEGPPAFSATPLKRLHSWTAKNLDWGNQTEVAELQRQVKAIIDGGVTLVGVVHVMLHRWILPLQVRAISMWEFKPKDEAVVQEFFRG